MVKITNEPIKSKKFTYFEKVLETVKSLKNSPCTDAFELNSRIIKETIDDIILPLLTILINACFSNGVFPDCFKLVKDIYLYLKKVIQIWRKLSAHFNYSNFW